jgi:hypothetical protein
MAYDVVAILPLRFLLWKTLKSRHNGFVLADIPPAAGSADDRANSARPAVKTFNGTRTRLHTAHPSK